MSSKIKLDFNFKVYFERIIQLDDVLSDLIYAGDIITCYLH